VTRGIVARTPAARVSVLRVAPVFGAVVEAFDRIGMDTKRLAQVRDALPGTPTD